MKMVFVQDVTTLFMTKITSTQNEYIKHLVKLSQKKYRDEHNEILIEGEHLVQEAKNLNILETSIGISGCDIEITPTISQKLSQTKSGSSIFGLVKKPQYSISKVSKTLICERIQDPGNLGAIIRSAVSFGIEQIVLSEDCVDEYNDKVIRSTQGAVFYIPIVRMDLKEAVHYLKQNDIEVYATHLHTDSIPLNHFKRYKNVAIVLGSEGEGVTQAILKECTGNIIIPMQTFESLNVAVAASIICYHLQGDII